MTTLGLIGAGHIGSALAQTALDAGYDVLISNSRGPETLTDLVAELAARPTARGTVRAGTAEEAAAAADLAVVTIPVKAIGQVPVEPLAGKVVIDTNNYYPQRDGQIAALDDASTTSAELLQQQLPDSSVVKAFNHIQAGQIVSERSALRGRGRRRAAAGAPRRHPRLTHLAASVCSAASTSAFHTGFSARQPSSVRPRRQ
jgi:predicted dinucleotide-binding enzyme